MWVHVHRSQKHDADGKRPKHEAARQIGVCPAPRVAPTAHSHDLLLDFIQNAGVFAGDRRWRLALQVRVSKTESASRATLNSDVTAPISLGVHSLFQI